MKAALSWVLVILNVAIHGLGAEYRIQTRRPAKVGAPYQFSCQAQYTHKITASAGSTVLQSLRTNRVVELETRVEVRESDPAGRIASAALHLVRLLSGEGKDRIELLPPGTVVLASRVGDQEQFTVKGKPVDGETQLALSLVSPVRKQDGIDHEAFGTDSPRQIGESWDINVAPIVASFQKLNVGVNPEDLQGRATLEGVVTVGTTECLDLAAKVYIKKLNPPLPAGLKAKRFFGSIRMTGKLPLDVALGVLEESLDLAVEFAAEGRQNPSAPLLTVTDSSTLNRKSQTNYTQ